MSVEVERLPTVSGPRPVVRHPVVGVLVIAVVAALAAWQRIPAIARDTLWAEDGRIFVQGAIDRGPIGSLFIPYAGYLHTVPRLIASAVVSFVPVTGWAVGMTAGACLVAGILAATVFVATRGIIRWMPTRLVVAALTVLAPLAPREVLGDATNLHSLFLWTLVWIVLAIPRTRASTIGLTIVGLLGALTEVQSLFLLPLLALVLLRDRRSGRGWGRARREWARWIPRAAVLLGATAQLAVTLIFPRGSSGKPPVDPISLVYGYLVNAVMPLGALQLSVGRVLAATGPLLALAMIIPIAAAFVVVVRRGTSSERLIACALAIGSIVIYVASVTTNPDRFYDYAQLSRAELVHAWLTRYGVVPSMMLAAIVALGLSVAVATKPLGTPWWRDRRSVSLAAVGALLAISLASQFAPEFTRRSEGPAWQPQLAAASERCETLPSAATVSLRETIGWHVTMPCRLLAIPSRPGAISRLGW